MNRLFSAIGIAVVAAIMLIVAVMMRDAWAQEMVTVPSAHITRLIQEHQATLEALDGAEREIARLRVKLACV